MALSKADKTKYAREAIAAISPNPSKVTWKMCQKWLLEKYGSDAADVPESTFYNNRRYLIGFAKIHADAVKQQVPVSAPPADNGIAALVRQLKLVVTKLGKAEANLDKRLYNVIE